MRKFYRKHPVQNVRTGEVFESVTAGAKSVGVLPQYLMRAIREGRKCKGDLWKYEDKELVVREMIQKKEGKKIVELKSRNVFKSIIDAAESIGLSRFQIERAIKKRQSINGLCFAFESDYAHFGDELLKDYQESAVFNRKVREIVCLESGKHYANASVCAKELGVSKQCVDAAAKRHSSVHGCHLYYSNEDPNEIQFSGPNSGRKSKAVVDTTSGKVWKSLRECAKQLGITKAVAFYALNNGKTLKNGSFLIYYDDWLKH